MLEAYRKHLEARHLGSSTIKNHLRSIEEFSASFADLDLRDVTLTHFIRYRKRLAKRPIAIATQNIKLWHLKAFFTFLHERGKILVNPAAELPALRLPRRLPRAILDGKQVIALLRQPNTQTKIGIRNRAIVELLYSSGLRAGELCRLTVYDLDDEDHSVRIVQGKGRKDRIVPAGRVALDWCARYMEEVRPQNLKHNHRPHERDRLFLTITGNRMQTQYLQRIVKAAAKTAHIPDHLITTHSLRHACATEMLRGGASVRHVQEMLGHADITTTQLYTHVLQDDLKAIHKKTAPSERRKNTAAAPFELVRWRPRRNRPKPQ
jgi:integrase/recombinase XerD